MSLRCLPCLPSSWTKVQDWLHLVLLLGVLGSTVCVVQMIVEVSVTEHCGSPFCFKQIISGVLVLPSTVYFIKMIGQYDMELQEKKERQKKAVDDLMQELTRQNQAYQAVAQKMTERANTWALARFGDKRRYFEAWLKRMYDSELYPDESSMTEAKEFIKSWMNVYSGCLLRPEQSPLLKGLDEELEKCRDIKEVCVVALRRLSKCKVELQFIPESLSFTVNPRRNQAAISDGSSFSSGSGRAPGVETFADESGISARVVNPKGKCGVTWLSCTRSCACTRRSSSTEDRFPVTYAACIVRVKILSRQHANIIFAFWMDIALLAFELLSQRWASLALVAFNEVCIVSVLACFEQLNDIAILERQIETFQRHNEQAKEKHAKAMDDWQKVEQLHDLWEFRTMPSLAIYEKVHAKLEDNDSELKRGTMTGERRLEYLRYANAQLQVLDLKFGTMEEWRGIERLDEEWKATIGRNIKDRAEGDVDADSLLKVMPFLLSKDLHQLEADVPGMREASGSRAASSSHHHHQQPGGGPSPLPSPRSPSGSFASSHAGHDDAASSAGGSFSSDRRTSGDQAGNKRLFKWRQ